MLLALLLAVRSLAPAGFMPAFEHGRPTLVACPDADGSPSSMAHHHHPGDPAGARHQPCRYAASVGAAVGSNPPAIAAPAPIAPAIIAALPPVPPFLEQQRDRPWSTGPPLLA